MTDWRALAGLVLWTMIVSLGITQTSCMVRNGFTVAPFTVEIWASDVAGARGLVVDDEGDVLVVARDAGGIYALWEDLTGEQNRTLILRNSALTHGIALYANHLYASSDSMVWRWNYTAGQRREVSGPEETVVRNIDRNSSGLASEGQHQTRSLAIDGEGILYVSVGSTANVDPDSFRARIRAFDLRSALPVVGYDFASQGTLFADGLRNEVGLAFDGRGRLWGVENGADQLWRDDLGGDIHEDNPAEELNLFDGPAGTFYGYPFCWSEYLLAEGTGRGSQWAWPSLENGTYTDAWCKNESNVRPPELAMQAHSAPLGITFFDGNNCGQVIRNSTNETLYAFSCEFVGDALVAFHGSWNRDVPVGFKVARIGLNATTGLPTSRNDSSIHDIFGSQNSEAMCSEAGRDSCIRPVDVKFDKRGALLVTSDSTGEIFRVAQSSLVFPPSSSSASPLGIGSGSRCRAVLSLLLYVALCFWG